MGQKKQWLNEERADKAFGPSAPFGLYSNDRWGFLAPIMTMPGKPPHRIASTVVRK